MAAEGAIHRSLISLLSATSLILGQVEEISVKPQLMGDIFAVTPTSCANLTPAVESLVESTRRVEVNSTKIEKKSVRRP